VPHGGARSLLGTNPYAFALPAAEREPVVVDFATSAAARGKINYYRSRKEPLPEGWLLDSEGRPSRDAEDLWRGGMQLPMAGHKG
jgi:LDH2 family malate/lactate/ureidoglycolate dehydrogenase